MDALEPIEQPEPPFTAETEGMYLIATGRHVVIQKEYIAGYERGEDSGARYPNYEYEALAYFEVPEEKLGEPCGPTTVGHQLKALDKRMDTPVPAWQYQELFGWLVRHPECQYQVPPKAT